MNQITKKAEQEFAQTTPNGYLVFKKGEVQISYPKNWILYTPRGHQGYLFRVFLKTGEDVQLTVYIVMSTSYGNSKQVANFMLAKAKQLYQNGYHFIQSILKSKYKW